jgi:hypothetical protein
MPDRSMELGEFDTIAEASQVADHLARSHLLGVGADGQPSFPARDELMEVVRDLLVEIRGATEALETLLQDGRP